MSEQQLMSMYVTINDAIPTGIKNGVSRHARPSLIYITTQCNSWGCNLRKELLASHQLLCDHAGGGDHGEAAVVELLGLHFLELLRILGLEPKRVKAQVSWLVVIFNRPQ